VAGSVSSYTITITLTTPSDGNDSFLQAIVLASGASQSYNIASSDPADYFKIYVTSGQQISVSLTGLTNDLNIDLYNPSQAFLASSAFGGTNPESINYTAGVSGEHYVRVYPYVAGTVSSYTITITITAISSFINGWVYDNDTGAAISGATVTVTDSGGSTVVTTSTDGSGYFNAGVPGAGPYNLIISKSGYIAYNFYTNNLYFIPPPYNVGGIYLPPSGITGWVYDNDTGAAISGATVTVTDSGGFPVVTISTDGSGYFNTGVTGAGSYNLIISKSGYITYNFYTNNLEFISPPSAVGVNLTPNGITGHVYDNGTYAPISGATVAVTDYYSGALVTTVYTDGNGYFIANVAPYVSYNVTISATGYTSSSYYGIYLTGGYYIGYTYLTSSWYKTPGATVLLVDDDGGFSYETKYANALTNNGVIYDTYSVAIQSGSIFGNGPSSSIMSQYTAVVWLTDATWGGGGTPNTLTADDRANLTTYLNSGGKLFIAGRYVGYNLTYNNPDVAFYNTYLHATYGGERFSLTYFNGVSGDSISGFLASGLPLSGTSIDSFSPTGGATTIFKIVSYGSSYDAGLSYSGTYKLVYTAIGLQDIALQADADILMDNILAFFGL
jgi:hypothetical protein